TVEDTRRPEGEDATLGKRRRGPRPSPALHVFVARGILVRPERPTIGRVQANDGFPTADLFLREKSVANDDDRRPGRPNSSLPKQLRRSNVPSGGNSNIAKVAVAIRATKSGPVPGPQAQRLSLGQWRGRVLGAVLLREVDL